MSNEKVHLIHEDGYFYKAPNPDRHQYYPYFKFDQIESEKLKLIHKLAQTLNCTLNFSSSEGLFGTRISCMRRQYRM